MPIQSRYLPDSIDVVHAGTAAGRYGDDELDWTNATVTTVPAIVLPLSQAERFDEARDMLSTEFRVFANQEGISGYDRIVWPSGSNTTYEVMGQPSEWRNPVKNNAFDHSEFTMRLVEG